MEELSVSSLWLAVSMLGLASRLLQIKEDRNFCEMKASMFVLQIILSMITANNQKAQKQV